MASSSAASAAVADDINRARSVEEMDDFMRKTRATERELKELVERELATAKVAEVQVSEQWRKILRLAKVRHGACKISADPAARTRTR